MGGIKIEKPSLCQNILEKFTDHLLIRPVYIYEIPCSKKIKRLFGPDSEIASILHLKNSSQYLYKSNQKIKSSKRINLSLNVLDSDIKTPINILFNLDQRKNSVTVLISKNFYLPNYLTACLRYTNIQSLVLIEPKQYVDTYTTLGYFERISCYSFEIVNLKSKNKDVKEILLITNDDC